MNPRQRTRRQHHSSIWGTGKGRDGLLNLGWLANADRADVRSERGQFRRMLARFGGTPPCPVNVDPHVAAVNPAKLPEPVPKCRMARLTMEIVSTCVQNANTATTLALLRAHRAEPHRCCAAKQRDD